MSASIVVDIDDLERELLVEHDSDCEQFNNVLSPCRRCCADRVEEILVGGLAKMVATSPKGRQ